MERFVGMLIEHFAAAFPLWLAPEQVRILGLNDDMLPYCEQLRATLQKEGFRAIVDYQSANVKKKIRDAQLDLVPYMIVAGPKDRDQGGVSLRDRLEGDLGFMSTQAAFDKLKQERDTRVIRQVKRTAFQSAAASSSTEESHEY
jgi:threonyl-tRNA synthetase